MRASSLSVALSLLKIFDKASEIVKYIVSKSLQVVDDVEVKAREGSLDLTLRRRGEIFKLSARGEDVRSIYVRGSFIGRLVSSLVVKYYATGDLLKVVLLLVQVGDKTYRTENIPPSREGIVTFLTSAVNAISMLAVCTLLMASPQLSFTQMLALLTALLAMVTSVPVVASDLLLSSMCRVEASNGKIVKYIFEVRSENRGLVNLILSEVSRVKDAAERANIDSKLSELAKRYGVRFREEVIYLHDVIRDIFRYNKRPKIYVVRSERCNALSYGLRDGVIVLTTKLLARLSADELKAVISHEYAHIVRNDTLRIYMLLAAGQMAKIAALTALLILCTPLTILMLALIVITLIHHAAISYISRKAELSADEYARCCTDVKHLVSAMIKVGWRDLVREIMLGKASAITNIFSSHPTILTRLANITSRNAAYKP